MTLRYGFAITYFVTFAVMLYLLYIIAKRKEAIRHTTLKLVASAAISVAVSAFEMLWNNYTSMVIFRVLFYVTMDILCYMLLVFIFEYTGLKKNVDVVYKASLILISIDLVSLLISMATGHLGEFVTVSYNSEEFLILHPSLAFSLHLLLCYAFIMTGFVRLAYMITKSSSLYRLKFICIIAVLILIVVLDALFLSTGFIVDISIVFFALAALLLTYFTFYFVPRELKNRIQNIVFTNMKDYVIIFDEEDSCIYVNKNLNKIGFYENMKLDEFESILRQHLDEEQLLMVEMDEDIYYFEQSNVKLSDDKSRYLGIFYVLHDVSEEYKLQKEQYYLANYDTLTGLYNRTHFIEKATDYMHMDPDHKYLLICTDIRHFKTLNDIFGARVGDQVLETIARQLKFIDNDDMVYGRIGDDSFALCVKEEGFDIEEFAEKLKSTLQIPYLQYRIVNHLGIYKVEDIELSVSAMCDRAMMAIADSKNDLQNEITYYTDSLRDSLLHEQSVLRDVEKAFSQHQFTIYLQPQINHRTHRVDSAEALVRWIHPEKGIIYPNDFIPIMEKHELITRLDRYVWDLACQQLQKWYKEGRTDMSISVNLSTKDIYNVDLYEEFTGLIKKYGIPSKSLRLEITETTYALDVIKQLKEIDKLRAEGFIVEMDDFGSGYSSLNTLKAMPVDVLKLDMEFMSVEDRYNRSADIVRMIVAMADVLGIPVIAEGVETQEQADFLGSVGCDMIQGYYYAKPMPINEYEILLKEFNG